MRGDGYQCAGPEGSVTQADVHEAANALLDGGRAETVHMGAACKRNDITESRIWFSSGSQ